jgi:hypothetical protein
MSREVIKVQDRETWLAERVKDVTSTEISALYGLNPYKTEFELFHEKQAGKSANIAPNERMVWGNRLESAIAHGAAEDHGWNIEKLDVYIRVPEFKIGSSFDFEIKSSANGPGILEVKNVDGLQYKNTWIDDGAGNIEAPEHIELQIQHQLEVSGYSWCALVALVGGNQTKIILRNRDESIGKDIRAKVSAFWDRVNNNIRPSADYTKDADFIINQLQSAANSEEFKLADGILETLITDYNFLKRELDSLEELAKSRKAEILEKIGTASKVFTRFGTLNCSRTKDTAPVVITADMIGKTYGGRSGYRNFRFTPKKGD